MSERALSPYLALGLVAGLCLASAQPHLFEALTTLSAELGACGLGLLASALVVLLVD